VILNSSHLVGNIGLGPQETSVFQKTNDTGVLDVDPTATPDLSNVGKDFTVSGGIVTVDLTQAGNDANTASAADAALTPTQTFGDITQSFTITGNGGVNVIALNSLNYNAQTLTLQGSANDVFIINVAGGFTFAQSQIVLTGGVTANQVLFNFPGSGAGVTLYKSSNVINGTFLAPERSIDYHNPASFNGAIIALNIDIHSNANLTGAAFTLPIVAPPASLTGYVTDQNGFGLLGVIVNLTGTDNEGNTVNRTATTDSTGFYQFMNLAPSDINNYRVSYQVSSLPSGYVPLQANAGTVNGNPDGTAESTATTISQVALAAGQNGINYDFLAINLNG
jgi:hypothetical protein